MIKINLLPRGLRERKRGISKGTIYLILGCVGVILILFVLLQYQKFKLRNVNKSIAIAQRETTRLAPQIRLVEELERLKTGVEERMRAIEELDKNRAFWIKLLERFGVAIPDNLWLTSFKESGDGDTPQVIIEGESYSLNNLATLMLRLGYTPFFDNVELNWVKQSQQKERKTFSFQLACNLSGWKPVSPPAKTGETGKG